MSGSEMKSGAGGGQSMQGPEERLLDQRIQLELERMPEISADIPVDFAARVAARVPARPPVKLRRTHYGGTLMGAGLIVSLAALIVLALQGAGQSVIGQTIEGILSLQFLVIAVWMGTSRWRSI